MTETPPQDVPAKEVALTYRGDTRDMVGQKIGPDARGETFTVASAEYNLELDSTRVVLTPRQNPRGAVQWWDGELNPVDPPENVQVES